MLIGIQFPKNAVNYVKMLIAEILPDFVYVRFLADLPENCKDIRLAEFPEKYLIISVQVIRVENPHNDCIGVFLLEIWVKFQKFQTWMIL